MAREQKTTIVEDIFKLVALMPWWIGLILAFVGYLLFHWLAAPVALEPVSSKNAGFFVAGVVVRGIANAAQYIFPIICVAAAGMSAWRRGYSRALFGRAAVSNAADKLDGISWADFELLVGEAFRRDGFAVEEHGGAQADGGVDLVLRRNGEKFLVQCKQWRAQKVSVEIVRELAGVMGARGATGGFVVTSGSFTPAAQEFAVGRNIVLIDGPILLDMIERAERAPTANPHCPSPSVAPPTSPSNVTCPVCNSGMVRRVAKKGTNAGSEFWGCSRFPSCKGTRPI